MVMSKCCSPEENEMSMIITVRLTKRQCHCDHMVMIIICVTFVAMNCGDVVTIMLMLPVCFDHNSLITLKKNLTLEKFEHLNFNM